MTVYGWLKQKKNQFLSNFVIADKNGEFHFLGLKQVRYGKKNRKLTENEITHFHSEVKVYLPP